MSKFFPDKFPGFEDMGNTFLPYAGKLFLLFLPKYFEVKLKLGNIYKWEIDRNKVHVSLVRCTDGGVVLQGYCKEGPFVIIQHLNVWVSSFKIRPEHSGLGLEDINRKLVSFMKNEIEAALPNYKYRLELECNSKACLHGYAENRECSARQFYFYPELNHPWAEEIRSKISFSLEQVSGENDPLIGISVGRVDPRDKFETLEAYWEEIIPEGTVHHACIKDVADWTQKWEAAAKLGNDLVNTAAMWKQYKTAMKKYEEFLAAV